MFGINSLSDDEVQKRMQQIVENQLAIWEVNEDGSGDQGTSSSSTTLTNSGNLRGPSKELIRKIVTKD